MKLLQPFPRSPFQLTAFRAPSSEFQTTCVGAFWGVLLGGVDGIDSATTGRLADNVEPTGEAIAYFFLDLRQSQDALAANATRRELLTYVP